MSELREAAIYDQQVDQGWTRIPYQVEYAASRPLVFAAMQTANGRDSASLRMASVRGNRFRVRVQEEQTEDIETAHREEEVGYFAIDSPGQIHEHDSHDVIGMAGLERIDQPDPDMNYWQRIDLPDFQNPVVFTQILSNNGTEPVHPRVAAVSPEVTHRRSPSFFYKLEEWSEGTHEAEWVAWLAMDLGSRDADHAVYRLAGSDVRAKIGTFTSNHEVPREAVKLDELEGRPVVFSQCQSYVGPDSVVTRQEVAKERRGDDFEFKAWLQESEAGGNWHTRETIGYIAVETTH